MTSTTHIAQRSSLAVAVCAAGLLLAPSAWFPATAADSETTSEVTDSEGQPVAGATITVVQNPTPQEVRELPIGESMTPEVVFTALTNSAGEYETPDLPNDLGDYSVTAEAPGFSPTSVFVDEAGSQSSLAAVGKRSVRQVKSIHLRPSKRGRAALGVCDVRYSPVVYTKLEQTSRSATVGNLFSRTSKARMSLDWNSGSQVSLGVGVDLSSLGGSRYTTTRDISNGAAITFPALASEGQRVQKTSTYYVKWRLTRTKTVICGKTTRTTETWTEWRPEGLNGGNAGSYKIDNKPPAPPNANWCAYLFKGKQQVVTNGRATRTEGALDVGGFSLSAQAGHDNSISVTAKAETGAIKACGYRGPAATDAGQIVAIPG